jgi:hypothetical protein
VSKEKREKNELNDKSMSSIKESITSTFDGE